MRRTQYMANGPCQKSKHSGTTGETACPTELHQQFALLVGQAFSLSGILPRTAKVEGNSEAVRVIAATITVGIAFVSASACLERIFAQDRKASGMVYSSKRMADGKEWTTQNLDVNTALSYCYEDAEVNCRQYGRLYTWESAQGVCRSLGDGWRLPTDDEWRRMAKRYGGVSEDSDDKGKAAFKALLAGGSSGFNAVLGGGRSDDAQYARLKAHGFYWTASESDPASGWFYNFGLGGQALHRQIGGEKQRAFSVRCVRE